jgi:hypothetical protein
MIFHSSDNQTLTPLEKLSKMSDNNKDLEKLVKEFNLEVTI